MAFCDKNLSRRVVSPFRIVIFVNQHKKSDFVLVRGIALRGILPGRWDSTTNLVDRNSLWSSLETIWKDVFDDEGLRIQIVAWIDNILDRYMQDTMGIYDARMQSIAASLEERLAGNLGALPQEIEEPFPVAFTTVVSRSMQTKFEE